MNEPRVRRLVDQAISTFDLDLTGSVILTEAATGYYILTSMIAALAGAERVLAITRDSRFGRAMNIRDATLAMARRWGIANRIEVIFSRTDKRIRQADVVTNLGFVRPLDADFLSMLKSTAAISLMWETWEFRPDDLNLTEARRLDIPVLGTNEHHPTLCTFEYLGLVAVKLLLELNIEVFNSKVVIIGSCDFAAQIHATLWAIGAEVTHLDTHTKGILTSDAALTAFHQADAIVVAEHRYSRPLLGQEAEVTAGELCALNPGVVVAHLCGNVDRDALTGVGLRCRPDRFARHGYMSVATDYVGPRPLIELHTAGLGIGVALAKAKAEGLSAIQAELSVLKQTPIAQGFYGYHDTEG